MEEDLQGIEDLRRELENARRSLVAKVNGVALGGASKLPLKFLVLREALQWRLVEIGDGVVQCLEADNYLAATILARSALEVTALQRQLNSVVKGVKDRKIGEVDADLMRLVLGSRMDLTAGNADPEDYRITNILTCIAKLDKEFEGTKWYYEHLSEYCHPNWQGTAGLFSQNRTDTYGATFGRYVGEYGDGFKGEPWRAALAALSVFRNDYEDIVGHLEAFYDFCDRESRP